MSKERLPYIDVFKGFLIIMVVFGHVVYLLKQTTGAELPASPYNWTQYIASVWMAPYYMAAFFISTGYCSDFNQSIKKQINNDLKRLIIPAISVPLIMNIITSLFCTNDQSVFSFILKGQLPWFLVAMFWARIIYRSLLLLRCKQLFSGIILCFFSLGACWLLRHKAEYEFLSIIHGLAFSIFLWIGQYFKRIEINRWWIIPSVIIYCLIAIPLGYKTPSLCADIYFETKLWPLYLVVATAGSLSVFLVSRLIGSNRILEFLGRNSLIIYLTHFAFIIVFATLLRDEIIRTESMFFPSSFLILAVVLGGLTWGTTWSVILNRNYMKWIIGK